MFDGIFFFAAKASSKQYQAPLKFVAYVLQKLFKGELERCQQKHIIAPLGIDETAEWCNSFLLITKPNGKVRLCLVPARLNEALIIRPVHREPTLNDIFPKLNNIKCLSLIDAFPGYHNLKLDERSSYLTTYVCQFGRYRYKRLPFRAVPAGNMFQQKKMIKYSKIYQMCLA